MPHKETPRTRFHLEQLEDRRLLAGNITFNFLSISPEQVLVNVQGTLGKDQLTVSYGRNNLVKIKLSGDTTETAVLPVGMVNVILFQSSGAQDGIRNRTAIPLLYVPAPVPDLRADPFLAAETSGLVPGSLVTGSSAVSLTADEQLILQQTNAYRVSHGLVPLTVNPLLEQMAQGLASAEAAADRYGDSDTNGHIFQGHDPVWRAAQVGYQWVWLGENVAYNLGYPNPAQTLMTQWWNSPEHQANILDPNYTEIGIAVARGASGRTYGVVDFGAEP